MQFWGWVLKGEVERAMTAFMETAASIRRLLSDKEMLEFVSEIEDTRDPDILTDLLHVEEHRDMTKEIKNTIKVAYKNVTKLQGRFAPFW